MTGPGGKGAYGRLSATIVRINESLMIAVAVAITAIVIYQVIARLGHFSVRWTEELARFLSIWATFLAVPVLISHRRLINIDFFQLLLPYPVQRVLSVVQIVVAIGAFLVLIWVGSQQVMTTWKQTSPGLLWPMGLFTLPIIISSILSLIVIPDWFRDAMREPEHTLDTEKFL